ncbi:MAG: family 10 glycosylhydrolase [Chitinophagales bacterium]|nr:family 10 glycosylhydrolase [Chitinophagales bacterium]
MKIRFLWLFLFISVSFSSLYAQGTRSRRAPKHEMRAVWVATVMNLDFPEKPTTWSTAHKEQWKKRLEQYKDLGFNAVFFQVRPAGDAFYLSEFAPWSEYLTGRQDLPPKPEYDVLAYLIEETHKQGMEFHAWLNPFRATMNLDTADLSIRHVFNRHRRWVKRYGRRYYIDPGVPQAREHIRDVVAEVVQKYDVDGIHFDDYFYPFPVGGEPFPDSTTYLTWGIQNYKDINNWRRNNIDQFMEMISTTIKEIKPHVYFGVSPFGVWRNKEDDRMGSETNASVSSYDDLYADVLKWIRRDWIDYVVPQLYWHIGFEPADHQLLQRWWSLNKGDGQLYIGHAAYKIANDKQEQWYEPNEIARQIHLTRRNRRIDGSVFFRSSSVLGDPLNVKDTLRAYYEYPALLPEREGMSLAVFQAPDLKKVKNKRGDARIIWSPNEVNKEQPPYYYAIYKFPGAGVGDMSDPRNLYRITALGETESKYSLIDTKIQEGQVFTYVITAVNRAHIESSASEAITVMRKNGRVKKYKRPKPSKRRRSRG